MRKTPNIIIQQNSQVLVARAFSPRAQEREADISLGLRLVWSREPVPGQPGLHRNPVLEKKKGKKQNKRGLLRKARRVLLTSVPVWYRGEGGSTLDKSPHSVGRKAPPANALVYTVADKYKRLICCSIGNWLLRNKKSLVLEKVIL